MSELYIQKLVKLIKAGLITIDDIVDLEYKTEVQNRLSAP